MGAVPKYVLPIEVKSFLLVVLLMYFRSVKKSAMGPMTKLSSQKAKYGRAERALF